MAVKISAELRDGVSHLAAFAAGKATVKGILQIARFGVRMGHRTSPRLCRPHKDGYHVALAKLTVSELSQAALIEGRPSAKHEGTSVPVTRDTLRAWRHREILKMVKQVWRAVR